MPRVSEFYGIVIYMYWGDHHPPHFHAIYGGDEALVRISDGAILRGTLPRTAARLVGEWTSAYRDELLLTGSVRGNASRSSRSRVSGSVEFVSALARVTEVAHLGEFVLRLTFSDGLERDLDLRPMLSEGILATLLDRAMFARVTVDPVAGTVSWPNGIDLDPDVLHGDAEPASGAAPAVLAERQFGPAA